MNKHNDDILDTYVNRAEGARRGAVAKGKGKTRITIYLDNDVLDRYRAIAATKGRGYQTEINDALRKVNESREDHSVDRGANTGVAYTRRFIVRDKSVRNQHCKNAGAVIIDRLLHVDRRRDVA